MKKIYVLIGNFGSGKTEIALNIALDAAGRGRTELIDLDMVNTYFRLSERHTLIEASDIRLVMPNYAMKNIETLSLPAEVQSAFDMDWDTVVFDVGGDSAGATALGRYKADFDAQGDNLEVLNVINIRRPMSGTPEKIIALMSEIEEKSRLKITGLINNANLAHLTTADELRDGYEAIREVARQTGVKVRYTSGRRDVLEEFLAGEPEAEYVGEPLFITTYMHRDWETYTKFGI